MKKTPFLKMSCIVSGLMTIALAACSEQSITDVGTPTEATFSSIQQNILTPGCARSGCHLGGNAEAGLNLQAGVAFQNLVNVQSTEDAQRLRVEPNNANNSYFFRKIAGNSGIAGSRMPVGGRLSNDQIDAVRDWINAGALNN